MKKFLLLAPVLIIFILGFLIFFPEKAYPSATIDGKTFTIDVAKTPREQEKGLAIYNSIPKDKGMIFPFGSPDYYAFWMKDMKFPIDIIYIRNNRITDIFADVPPPKSVNDQLPIIRPKSPSDTVLEINAGLSNRYNFKIGDKVTINYQL